MEASFQSSEICEKKNTGFLLNGVWLGTLLELTRPAGSEVRGQKHAYVSVTGRLAKQPMCVYISSRWLAVKG